MLDLDTTRQLAVACVLILSACGPAPRPGSQDVESLREAVTAYHEAASAKDAETVVSMYDERALMVPPAGELVEGSEQVRGYRFGFIETPGVSLDFQTTEVHVSDSGDLGWSVAIGDITIEREDGGVDHDIVRDVHVWRRQADGTWKVTLDVWNSGPVPNG